MLTVIIPAYNEEKNLDGTVQKIKQELNSLKINYEILIVNDGSTDFTGQIAEKLQMSDKNIRVIHHIINKGPGSGIVTGIKNVKGSMIIFIPSDLAMEISQINKYLEAAKFADVVVGIRSNRNDYSLFRKFVSIANIILIKTLFKMEQQQFNYIHLYHSYIFDKIKIESTGVFITAEIMIKAKFYGYKIKEVLIDYLPRKYGKASCGNFFIITKTFIEMIKFWVKWNFIRKK